MIRVTSLLILAAIVFVNGCSGPGGENPIESGGELPQLVKSLPDEEYLVVGYVNLDGFFKTEIGDNLSSNFAVRTALNLAQIQPKEHLHEVAFAVQFNHNAYPNLYPAFPTIVIIRADVSVEKIRAWLKAGQATPSTMDGTEVLSYSGSLPILGKQVEGTAFITSPEEGLIVISTSKKLLNGYFAVRRGDDPGLDESGKMGGLLERLDKRATSWMGMQHTAESKSLLKSKIQFLWLNDFDDLLARIEAGEDLEITLVGDFPDDVGAREAVNSYIITRKELESRMESSRRNPKYQAMFEINNILYSFDATYSVDLAIFQKDLTIGEINKLISASFKYFVPGSDEEQEAETEEEKEEAQPAQQ